MVKNIILTALVLLNMSGSFALAIEVGNYDHVLVTKVISGGILQLEGGEVVSLSGVDVPECGSGKSHMSCIVAYAQRSGIDTGKVQVSSHNSYELLRSLCEGRRVRLEFADTTRDGFGRLLAYVYLPDGTFVNAAMIKSGYAIPAAGNPDPKYKGSFQSSYNEAQTKKTGMWAK